METRTVIVLAVTMLGIPLLAGPPLVTLAVHPLAEGSLQIIASSSPTLQRYNCVLQSTTNLVTWTAISTNVFSYSYTATNIVQATNTMTFYRAEAVALQ
jgi:hypothetical protein